MKLHSIVFSGALALPVLCCPAQSQFAAGSVYLMSAGLPQPPNLAYPGIRRVDPFTGATTPFLQFSSNVVYQDSAKYDPYRDRIVLFGVLGPTPIPAVHAVDAAGNWTTLSNTSLVRLAPRGDGKIYGYKAGALGITLQQIFYLDAANQEQVLLDVGGAAPWLLAGGTPLAGDPIRAMIYEPAENALFLALLGDNATPNCGAPAFDVSIRKLPLTADGTALRAPAVCSSFSVSAVAAVYEAPLGFSYGPEGGLVLAVKSNWSGAEPRLLSVDPVTAAMTPFAVVGPYTGDIAFACGAYCPTTGRALILDDFNDVFRTFAPGQTGPGTVLAPYGSPAFAFGSDSLFVVGPIGPGATLSADVDGVSVSAGGVQQLTFAPGPAFGGDLYLIAGSLTGWSPGFQVGGIAVPLNYDAYTDLTLLLANSPFLVNTAGLMPPSGVITAQIVLPPGVLLGLGGLVLHHAGMTADNPTTFTHASNPLPLTLLP